MTPRDVVELKKLKEVLHQEAVMMVVGPLPTVEICWITEVFHQEAVLMEVLKHF